MLGENFIPGLTGCLLRYWFGGALIARSSYQHCAVVSPEISDDFADTSAVVCESAGSSGVVCHRLCQPVRNQVAAPRADPRYGSSPVDIFCR